MLLDLTKAKREKLDEELGLYREALNDENVMKFTLMSKNSLRVDEIKRLRAIHGIPLRITENFAKENPELAKYYESQGHALSVGEIIFAEEVDFEEAKKHAEGAGVTLPLAPLPPATPEGNVSAEPVKDTLVSAELVYQRKTVVSVCDVIVSGRSYKDIVVASGETYRLTREEFALDVQPRK